MVAGAAHQVGSRPGALLIRSVPGPRPPRNQLHRHWLGVLSLAACANTAAQIDRFGDGSRRSDAASASDRAAPIDIVVPRDASFWVLPADASGTDDVSAEDSGAAGAPPRLLAPLSTTYVSSHRPTLTWTGETGVMHTVEICADRTCTRVVQSVTTDLGRFKPPTPLPLGTYFWRVRRDDGRPSGTSHTWQFRVRSRHDRTDYYYGYYLDMNGDGLDDALAISGGGQVTALYGSSTGLTRDQGVMGRPGQYGRVQPVGDVNGDGYGDVLFHQWHLLCRCGDYDASEWHIYLGSAERLRDRPIVIVDFESLYDLRLASPLSDINGDGFGDIAIGQGALLPRSPTMFLGGESEGRIRAQPLLSQRLPPSRGALVYDLGDLNADGRRDYLSDGNCTDQLERPAFDWFSYDISSSRTELRDGVPCSQARPNEPAALADVNNDGIVDVGLSGSGNSSPTWIADDTVYVFSRSGTWSTDERFSLRRAGNHSNFLHDYNADGLLDELSATRAGLPRAYSLMLGTSEGWRSGPPFVLSSLGNCDRVYTSGDFDGDGQISLLAVCGDRLYDVEVSNGGAEGQSSLILGPEQGFRVDYPVR